ALLLHRDRGGCAALDHAQSSHRIQFTRERRPQQSAMNIGGQIALGAQVQGAGYRDQRGYCQNDETLPAHVETPVFLGEAVRRRRRVDRMNTPASATMSGGMPMLMIFSLVPNRLMSTSRPRSVSRSSLRTRAFSAVKRFSSASCSGVSIKEL